VIRRDMAAPWPLRLAKVAPLTELPAIHASFRKKFGIPPKGKPPAGGWADCDYGYPLPPSDHPQAYKFARAVVRRAHQNTKFDPAQLAKHEYIPVAPDGSWEQIRGLVQRAAQRSDFFGGPANDDPKADDADTVRSYDIQVWGSFPSENRVVIYNDKTGGA